MSKEPLDLAGMVATSALILIVVAVIVGPIWAVYVYAQSRPTTYCTEWTRAVSIQPTNHDNGKYSDEQYVVKYEDGSQDGQSQGDIPYARCTNKVRVRDTLKKENWKTINSFNSVDWEE